MKSKIKIDNTFAEAFNMKASRILVTADNLKWAKHAAISLTGFATSVIACGVEAGIELNYLKKHLQMEETVTLFYYFQCQGVLLRSSLRRELVNVYSLALQLQFSQE